MIGHFLLSLTTAQEDRVLTGRLRRGSSDCRDPGNGYRFKDGSGCLLGIVYDMDAEMLSWGWPMSPRAHKPLWWYYDALCDRFGAPRVNAAIRNRILSNRAWRTLSGSAVVQQEATPK